MANIIFGIHSIEEAIDSDRNIDKLFVQKDIENQAIINLLGKAKKKHLPVSRVPAQKLNGTVSGNHQGVVAKISPIKTINLETMVEQGFGKTDTPLFVLLDEISDVRNFGAIVRTAECSGAQGIIIPKQRSAAINDQAVKTSSGAIFNIPIARVNHLKDAIYFLKSYDVQCVAATEKTEDSIYGINFKQPTAIIMGSEGKGVSKALLKMSDHRVKLPLLGQTESLNVSVACGLFLYEAVRQKL